MANGSGAGVNRVDVLEQQDLGAISFCSSVGCGANGSVSLSLSVFGVIFIGVSFALCT